MSDCCAPNISKCEESVCPACEKKGSPVEKITLLQQVKFPANMEITENPYYFCSDSGCTVGYFSATGTIDKIELITCAQIRSNWLCYCFDISVQRYQNALNDNKGESIKQFVTDNTTSKLCACRIRNPAGQCCLAKFRELDQKQSNLG